MQKLLQKAMCALSKLRPFASQMSAIVGTMHTRNNQTNAKTPVLSRSLDADGTKTPMDKICFEITSIEPNSINRLAAIEKVTNTSSSSNY